MKTTVEVGDIYRDWSGYNHIIVLDCKEISRSKCFYFEWQQYRTFDLTSVGFGWIKVS